MRKGWLYPILAGLSLMLIGGLWQSWAAEQRAVWEVARVVTWRRPFESLEGRARRAALGETYSHLVRLGSLGRIVHDAGEPHRWRPGAGREAVTGPAR